MNRNIISAFFGLAALFTLEIHDADAGEFADSALALENQLNDIQVSIDTIQQQIQQFPNDLESIRNQLIELHNLITTIDTSMDVFLANDSEINNRINELATSLANLQIEVDDHKTNHPTSGEEATPTILPIQPLILSPTDDATIRAGTFADTNSGSTATLNIKNVTEGDFLRYSIIKFDFSGIKRPVDSAFLRMYANSIQQNMRILLYEGLDNAEWSEDTVTWNTRPTLGTLVVTSPILVENNYAIWNITDYINNNLNKNVFTFVLVAESDVNDNINSFFSKESLINQPQISFVWQN